MHGVSVSDAICRYIAEHGVAVVDATATTATTCTVWASEKRWGWRIETQEASGTHPSLARLLGRHHEHASRFQSGRTV